MSQHSIMARFLGVDYGEVKTGVALSDESGSFAFPHSVITTSGLEDLADALAAIAAREGASGVVIGEPPRIEGMDSRVRETIHVLAETLARKSGLEVFLENEMFTTKIAEAHSKENADASAAALVLQSFLDRRKSI